VRARHHVPGFQLCAFAALLLGEAPQLVLVAAAAAAAAEAPDLH